MVKKKVAEVTMGEDTLQTILGCVEKMRRSDPDEIAEWSESFTKMHLLNQATRPASVMVQLPPNIFKLVVLGFQLVALIATDSAFAPTYHAYIDQKDLSRN